jgi:ABC-type transport system involved in multi-copper enzyme maturation permease subunit
MAILLGILLSATSLPRDEEQRYTYSLLTKPVSRSDMVLGKAIGASILAGIMILIAAVTTFLFLLAASQLSGDVRSSNFEKQDPLAVRSTVRASRRCSKGNPPLSAVALGAVGLSAESFETTSLRGLFTGETLVWQFRGLKNGAAGEELLLLLRTRVFNKGVSVNRVWVTGGAASVGLGSLGAASAEQFKARSKSIFLTVRFRSADRELRRIVLARSNETTIIPLDPGFLADSGDLDVAVVNSDPSMIAIFDDLKDRAGEERYGVGISLGSESFAQNLLSAYFLLWLRVLILIAFATATSTFTSAWTAALITLFFAVVGSSVPFMNEFSVKLTQVQIGHSHGGHNHDGHDHSEQEATVFHQGSAIVLKGMVLAVPDLSLFDSASLIMKGQKIPRSILARQSGVSLLNFFILLLLGSIIFHGREFT